MMDFKKPIYVLLYHPWMDGFEGFFTVHLSWLRDHGFESISLEKLMSYLRGEELSIPKRPIAITFDDGTIENYTIAAPLLNKYGFSGTVFAPTDDYYFEMSGNDWWRGVEEEGCLIIEGHSHTHALTFINDRIIDFFIKAKKDREPIIKGLDGRPGSPIFELGYELVLKRFIPDKGWVDECVNYVRNQGENYFERGDWKEKLLELASRYRGDRGRYETGQERERRIKEELEVSKRIIEEVIGRGKRVQFFAFPFGAYDDDLIEHLKNLGYIGAFTTQPGGNHKGDHPYLLKRMMILAEDSFGGLGAILKEYL